MEYCLWCDEELMMQFYWGNVIHMNNRPNLCAQCETQFKQNTGDRCHHCSRQSEQTKCEDCKTWTRIYKGKDPLSKNVSLFAYNSFMKEMITKWKYRGDFIISNIFQEAFVAQFNKEFSEVKKNATIIPIPLSKERLFERGFNQASVLASFLCASPEEGLIERIHSEKQSKKSRMERMKSENPFKLIKPINQPVILIDDIYTTGRTIRHAASLLHANGCPHVYAYTLVRG